MVRNGNFTLLLTSSGQEWQFSYWNWHLVVKNGKFRLLLTSSGQEWQFHISTDIYLVKNDNFSLLLPCLVVKNANLTWATHHSRGQELAILHLLLTSSCQEWQFYISACTSQWSRMGISHSHCTSGGQELEISHFYWHSSGQQIAYFTLLLTI